ncbi:hypothetical protein QP027_02645 [Corynebacterium breve]|uniref:Uncharacterized protein n=1 Tax=Corynebacterium breve TaxID=3049799 RepID=A0ABY8VI78_9CORY|nr:hypothetical protein [Corynebacterium breve]WIM68318.1 hypothetical protein QP027_02645 [Corynebacterium breve]
MTRWHTITDAGNRTGDFKPVTLNSLSTITHDLLVMDVAVTYAAIGAGVVPERIMRWADRGKVSTRYVIGANYFPDLIVGARGRKDSNLLTASHRTRLSYTGAWRTRDKASTTELRELYPTLQQHRSTCFMKNMTFSQAIKTPGGASTHI